MPTLKQLRVIWQVNKDLGFNKENNYGKNLPMRLHPIKFTGPVTGTITYDQEAQNHNIIPNSENQKQTIKNPP